MKKLNIKKKFLCFKCEIFAKKNPPTRHIKYKVKKFANSKKSIMANKLSSTSLERRLRRIKSQLTRLIVQNISRVYYNELAKKVIFKPP